MLSREAVWDDRTASKGSSISISRRPVWPALTTAEGLSAWFSDEVTLDLRPGGEAQLIWNESQAPVMRVERVEPPQVFGFTWPMHSAGDAARTYVESGFAQLATDTYGPTYEGHLEGWDRELGELVAYLSA